MKLQEIFDQLSYGELSQLSLGTGSLGSISEADWPKLLAHINLGLSALFKRFFLKEGVLVLQLQAGQSSYHLKRDYAQSNTRSNVPVKYIIDSGNPFVEDILKVEQVFGDTGHEYTLNDEKDMYSILITGPKTLWVPLEIVDTHIDLPEELRTEKLELIYRADHPRIVIGNGYFDPERVEIELPYSHLEALLYFVASRIHNPIGLVNEFNFGNNYAAKYEMVCQQLEQQNLRIDRVSTNTRAERNGWV